MDKFKIKWKLCEIIAHLSPKEQEIVFFLSANYLNGKAVIPSFVIRGGYSRVAEKVKKLQLCQVVLEGFKIPLFDEIRYSRGVVNYKFTAPIEQLLSERGNYLFCNFERYCFLRKKYAKAMYLLFCQFRGSGYIDKALHLLAHRIGATAHSYGYLSRLRRLIEDALGQIESHECVKFKLTKSGRLVVLEKRLRFSEHRIQIRFKLTDDAVAKKRSFKTHQEALYHLLRTNYKIPPRIALDVLLRLPTVYLRDLCKQANYNLPTLRAKTSWLIASFKNALSGKNPPKSKKPILKLTEPHYYRRFNKSTFRTRGGSHAQHIGAINLCK